MNMKTTLIVLAVITAVLGIITFIVVFYPSGSYQPVVTKGSSSSPATIGTIATGTPSTTAASATGTPAAGTPNSPYAISWNEGHGQFSVTNASLQGNTLTLSVAIQGGDATSCAPSSVRFAADESGTLKAPDSQICTGNGTNGGYNESLMFTADPSAASFVFTTGGGTNIFFTITPNASGGMDVTIPEQSG